MAAAPGVIQNYDSKGVKRGMCQECDECCEFEWSSSSSSSVCTYCGCPPTKHRKITLENNKSMIESNKNSPSSSKAITGSNMHLLPGPSRQHFQQIDLNSLIPKSFPHEINELLKNNASLESTEISAIVRLVCTNMLEKGINGAHHVEEMAVLLTNKFPSLKGPFGAAHLMIKEKIKQCLKGKQKNKRKGVDHGNHDALCEQMTVEISTSDRSLDILKLQSLLDRTRPLRQEKINSTSASGVLKMYPALRNPELLLYELSKLVNLPVATLQNNWFDAVPKVLAALKVKVPEDTNINGQCVHLLINLPKLFLKAKESGRMYRAFERGSTFDDVRPSKTEPPALLAISDSKTAFNNLQLMCYVDGETLFEACAFDAILYLIATFWIFNIAFPNDAKLQYSFISIAILRQTGAKQMKSNVLKSVILNNALMASQLT